ncbi:16S rRNA (adenine(1518)-N(6)/adenine(1519)-N(6))-dimethyltransferase RsmA [Syntrophus aciditrophicus]|uniref:Ribosomal RNA small subunit methyltransferase A n=1 Tax=Syntrophus aciditrophicus (strain SB) TaxID=56780 RepID=RSMA_SYNAS|nr:16S rRNA (adenine(1518)-N(6)/adenine(1519)-N(6))-dimethyltransferase RsmA [Syntrophus aciditrophicus]Q2LSQ6.1 RecName: Full=Ribosomal RNA small subunit methyltransferase A; AltName: Full=16S rRNA (adenine(1518)-N(6)/adenine(1519)-N(6))-dimethyltransferase; AltName: Full=16S rRNA dimethyladenosine transferase; AltName: Full=16S rRNA dimethylase; AltName: Full=S-adenosylmethionine-6-N', N'-adenosyl(rRNA) dimethyltransferase [Syntrophus aciditrophicus SB]ABC77113.1 dimethyladenosine transferase [
MTFVRQILRNHDIKPVKRLGQCFLADFSVMKKIVELAEIKEDETIVEIGSGLGLMTSLMAERAAWVHAVEIDGKLVSVLKERLKEYHNVTVIHGDILKYDFLTALGENSVKKIKIIGNIPYSISSPILFHILDHRKQISTAVLMMQKEVADRLCAVPGTKAYGIPTVLFGLYARISRELTVAPGCFYPKPEVTSTVVKMLIPEEPLYWVENDALFFRLVKAAFAQRRKTLLNNMKNAHWKDCDAGRIENLLRDMGAGEKIRAEELSIQQFAALCNSLSYS